MLHQYLSAGDTKTMTIVGLINNIASIIKLASQRDKCWWTYDQEGIYAEDLTYSK
jgi:hypothetical protein